MTFVARLISFSRSSSRCEAKAQMTTGVSTLSEIDASAIV